MHIKRCNQETENDSSELQAKGLEVVEAMQADNEQVMRPEMV